jgi:hypothetical protein
MTKPVRVLEGSALALLLFVPVAVAAVLEKLGRQISETFSLAP